MNFFIPNVFIHSIAKTFGFRLGIYYKIQNNNNFKK